MNFLDLSADLSDYDRAQIVILGIPYEASTTYGQGTRNGPAAIIQASSQVELYDAGLDLEPCHVGIATRMPFEEFAEPEQTINTVSMTCKKLLDDKKFVVGLGGEHTVSVGLVMAQRDFNPDMWVLQIDAHSDLRDTYAGSKWNHACTMARIGEICPYVGVGIRSGIEGERNKLAPPSKLWYAHEMYGDPRWPEAVLETLGDPVYITIDLDFFDPSVVPSVGTPEPGGFQWVETLSFLRKVASSRRIVGFDVVELSPKPGFVASDFLAAKLIYKLIGYVFEDTPRKGLAI